MQVTIGCELEGGLTDTGGNQVDTLAVLNGGIKTGNDDFEGLTSDLGVSSLECVSGICSSAEGLRASLERCIGLVPPGYMPTFKTKPFGIPVAVAPKPRYAAVAQALLREHPRGDQCIHTVAPWSSTQYHFGVPDVYHPGAVLLMNFLNNISPFSRLAVVKRYGIDDADGHLRIWQGWSGADRVPSARWFSGPVELHQFVGGIPKVVTKRDAEWVVAEGSSRIGDIESEGTIWWLARPRGVYSTIEWRPFPSLRPGQAADLGGDCLRLVHAFWEYYEAHPNAIWDTPQQAERLYRHLSSFDLVPQEPLSTEKWWELYNL